MKSLQTWTGVVLLAAAGLLAAHGIASFASQVASSSDGEPSSSALSLLPPDIYPDSLNRLPLVERDSLNDAKKKAYDEASSSTTMLTGLRGVAGIRLHGVTENLRYDIPVGRRLSEL